MSFSCVERIFLLIVIFSPYSCFSGNHRKRSRGARKHARICKEPNFSKIQVSMETTHHDSFAMMSSFLSSVVTLSDVPARYINVLITTLDDTRNCSVLQIRAKNEAGPMCPTYKVLNYDENRKPNSLVEARCSCKNCADPNAPGGLSTLLSCQPLVFYTRVLRRFACQRGTYIYHSTWEPLQVGCTCNFPQSRRSYTVTTHRRNIRSIIMDRRP